MLTRNSPPVDPDRYRLGIDAATRAIADTFCEVMAPKPRLSLSEWSAEYARLSAESSAQPGEFRAFGYQIGMMDAITDPTVTHVTVMKSARVGYTQILKNVIGYYAHWEPSPILLYQPRESDAERFSRVELEPMLRDTPALESIVPTGRAKDGSTTVLRKAFRNSAALELLGANSPDNFRARTARVVCLDEVDAYPPIEAGDQIDLAERRSETFWNSKNIRGSTPTEKGGSRIEREFLVSDRRRCFVPCPHCSRRAGEPAGFQVLEWGGVDTPHGIKWDRDESGAPLPETAHYVCRFCQERIDEGEKPWMDRHAEWRQTAEFTCCGERQGPELWSAAQHGCRRSVCRVCGQDSPFDGRAGLHIWSAYSMHPKATWKHLVREWLLKHKDPAQRKGFVNETLGETWEEIGERTLDSHGLYARREIYEAECPNGVAVIVVGVDKQGDRLEASAWGFGRDEESWLLAHRIFPGDPCYSDVWADLDDFLLRRWKRLDGKELGVEAACVDTGGGTSTEEAYRFCIARTGRRVWGIKGEASRDGKRGPIWPTIQKISRSKGRYRPVQINVNSAKDTVRARLLQREPGPGYMHFPAEIDVGYFDQLTAERLVPKRINGVIRRLWEPQAGRANEASDCANYAYAALCGLMHHGFRLNARADGVGAFASREMRLAEGEVRAVEREEPTLPPPPPAIRERKIARMAMPKGL